MNGIWYVKPLSFLTIFISSIKEINARICRKSFPYSSVGELTSKGLSHHIKYDMSAQIECPIVFNLID